MRRMLSVILLTVLFGCSDSQDDGIKITYYEKGNDPLEFGQVLLLWVNYETDSGQELIATQPGEPMALLYDSAGVQNNGMIMQALGKLKVGDSVFFQIPSKDLWENSFRRPLPDTIAETSSVNVTMRVIDQMNREDYQAYYTEREQKRNQVRYEEEDDIMKAYLAQNGIDAMQTESGLRYVITEEGNGIDAEIDKRVSVKYAGKLLDGTQFDAGTYEFILGRGEVIRGWDEGIDLLKVGSKAVLYIPSSLGYGSRGAGARIPPYSSLIFEVELLNVE
jgi:FKBP-type peptidyl-prolyl cis-trans isomerase